MIVPQLPANEPLRLQDVYKINLLDTPAEAEFDEIVQLASDMCDTPISLITILDTDRQWFKAKIGLDADQTDRNVSFCAHAILQEDIFEVPDALLDKRFSDNPLVVEEPKIRFYAGMPLVTASGSKLGTLCVIDRFPRKLTDKQKFALRVLAANVIKIAELRIKNDTLINVTESQKRIISILAHDVRNPLASIKSIIQLKMEDFIDDDSSEVLLDLVSKQLDSTLEMVDNVVNWGQLLMQHDNVISQETILRGLVDKIFVSDDLAARLKENRLINAVREDIVIYNDSRAVTFILRNLVSNAIKFTQNGSITVNAEKLAGKVEITVTDSGVGMDPNKAEHLFENVQQSSTLGTNNEKGSGLGLMLIKEFVSQLGGTISVESKLGVGSRFIIQL